MEITLERRILHKDFTIGEMCVDAVKETDTIEDTYRIIKSKADKVYGRTAIPCGRYSVVLDFSGKYRKQMPHVLDVPFFEGIRIHSGNSDEDSLGCIIVGEYVPGVAGGFVKNSRIAYEKLFAKMKKASDRGERIFITVSIGKKIK